MPRLETEMAQLRREQEMARKNYEQMLARSESASLGVKADASAELAEFRIVEPPTASRWPAFPGPLHGAAGLLLLAPLLGLAAAALAEWLRPTIHDARSLRLLGERPVLGTVAISHTPETQRRERLAGTAFALAVRRRAHRAGRMAGAHGRVPDRAARARRCLNPATPMKLIQQAVQRLEQLSRPGARMPGSQMHRLGIRARTRRDATRTTIPRGARWCSTWSGCRRRVCSLCRARDRPRPSNSAA